MKFTRDDWMVIERALQDRVAKLEESQGFGPGSLRYHEVQGCNRLRGIINKHIDATQKPPA